MNKTSEIGQILMSIDNLYKKCIERKKDQKGGIVYAVKSDIPDPKNFDDVKKRGEYAKLQIEKIGEHLEDFNKLLRELKEAQR